MSLILIMIFSMMPCWAFDADDYIAKLYKPLPAGVQALELLSFDQSSYDQEIGPWLRNIEAQLSRSNIASVDASFLMIIDQNGHISNLELDEAGLSTNELREFVSKLSSLKLEPRPAILANTRLRLEAKHMVISHNEKLEHHSRGLFRDCLEQGQQSNCVDLSIAKHAEDEPNAVIGNLEASPPVDTVYQVSLVSPEFFTAPRVGDNISFKLDSKIYMGRVIETGKHIIIATDALVVANELRAETLQYWRLEQHRDSGTWDSMFAGATSAGLGLGLASHGVATGIFAGLAALASKMQEAEVSIDAGDKFYLRKVIARRRNPLVIARSVATKQSRMDRHAANAARDDKVDPDNCALTVKAHKRDVSHVYANAVMGDLATSFEGVKICKQ